MLNIESYIILDYALTSSHESGNMDLFCATLSIHPASASSSAYFLSIFEFPLNSLLSMIESS